MVVDGKTDQMDNSLILHIIIVYLISLGMYYWVFYTIFKWFDLKFDKKLVAILTSALVSLIELPVLSLIFYILIIFIQ